MYVWVSTDGGDRFSLVAVIYRSQPVFNDVGVGTFILRLCLMELALPDITDCMIPTSSTSSSFGGSAGLVDAPYNVCQIFFGLDLFVRLCVFPILQEL